MAVKAPDESSILIAEDNDLLFDGIKFYVGKIAPAAHIVQVRQAGELIKQAEIAEKYALIVIDTDLPGFSFAPSFAGTLNSLARVPVAILATNYNNDDLTRAYDFGAKAYIPKTNPGLTIIAGLSLAMCGHKYIPYVDQRTQILGTAASALGESLSGGVPDLMDDLTMRQRQILELLVEGKTSSEIARSLGLADATIRFHLRRAYRRLGVRNRAAAVREVLKQYPQGLFSRNC